MGTPNNGINGTLGTGLIGHWGFDNGSLLDESVNGRNLTMTGTVASIADKDGIQNNAMDFDGASKLLTPISYNILEPSISVWFKTSINSRTYRMLTGIRGMDYHFEGFGIYLDDNSNLILVLSTSIDSVINPCDGEWHNAIALYNKTQGYLKLYLDKILIATATKTNAVPYTITNYIGIGATPSNRFPDYYTGNIDEVRIYGRPLTDGDITTVGQMATGEVAEIYEMGVNYSSASQPPTIMPPSGTYTAGLTSTISPAVCGDRYAMYYTTDGTDPTEYSEVSYGIDVNLEISTNTIVKAFAIESGLSPSEIVTANYIITNNNKVTGQHLFFSMNSNIKNISSDIETTDYRISYNSEFTKENSIFSESCFKQFPIINSLNYLNTESRFNAITLNDEYNISFFAYNLKDTEFIISDEGTTNNITLNFGDITSIVVNGTPYTYNNQFYLDGWAFYSINYKNGIASFYSALLTDGDYINTLSIPKFEINSIEPYTHDIKKFTIKVNNSSYSLFKNIGITAKIFNSSQQNNYFINNLSELYTFNDENNYIRVYIGEINPTLNSRKFIEVTDYIEKEFTVTLPYIDEIPTLSNFNIYLPTTNSSEYQYLSDDIKSLILNKDFSKFPILIRDNNNIIFNGILDTVDMEYIKGINPEYIRYKCTAKHKSSELDYIQINRKVSNIGNKIDLFLKELIETNTKINKFKYKTSTTNVINSTSLNYIDLDVYGKSSDNSIRVGDVLYVKNSGIIQSGFPKVIKKIDKIVSNMVSCTSAILDNYNENDAYSDSSGKYFTIVNSGLYNMLYLKNKNGIIIAKGIAENNGTTNSAELSPINIYKTKLNITFTDINELDTEKKIYIEKLRVSFFDNIGYTVFNEMFIGYDIVSEVVNEFKIYEPQIKFETLYYTLNRISEKYYINYTINDFCSIKLFDTAYIEDSETLIINNNRVIDELGISTQGGELMNSLYISDFKESEYVETLEPINKMINKYNIFHKTDKEVSNTSDSINIDNGSPDNYDTNGYVYLGNNENSHIYTEIFVGNLDISNIFLKNIIIPVSRSNFVGNVSMYAEIINNNQTIYNSIIPESNIDANLTIPTIFFNIKNTSKLGIYFTYKTSTKINSISEYGLNRYIIQFDSSNQDLTDCIGTSHDSIILSDGTYSFRLKVIQSTAPNTYICSIEYEYPTFNFTLSNFVNTYIYTEKLGEIDELIEFKMTNMQNSEYFETIKNIHGHTLVKSYDFQNSYMVYYPCKKLGANFNGEYEIAYPQYIEGISTNILKYEPNVLNDYTFSPLLDIDLVYIQIYDNDLDTWNTFKVKSFNKVTGELTLWDSVVLKSGYEIDNSLSKMLVRRVINTTDINSGEKPSNDTYYEGYIFKERGAYGFNTTVESNLIKYINGDTSVIDKCYPYIVGEIIGCYYNTEIPRVKYDNNIDSIDKYGYLEEVQSSNFVNVEDYNIYSRTELLTRAFPLKSGNIKLKYNLLNSDKLKKYIKIEGSICDNNEYFLVNKYEQIYNLSISKSDIYKLNAIIEEVV